MKFKLASLLILSILMASFAFAVTAPDVNTFSATWDRSYIKNGSITFTFKVLDVDINGIAGSSADLNAQIWLVKDYNNNTTYLGDWNLMGGGAKYATCTVTDFNRGGGSSCSITYTLNESTDGNYWFDLNVYSYEPGDPTTVIDSNWVRSQDGGATNDLNFYIDNTAPTAITDFTVKDNRNKSITLDWKALSSVTPLLFASFKTYYSTTAISSCASGTLDTTSTSGTLITDDISSLTPGTNYWTCVLVTDVAGNTADSSILGLAVTDEIIGTPVAITAEQQAQVAEAVGAQAGAIGNTNVFGTMVPTWILIVVGALIVVGLFMGGKKVRKKKKKR